MNTPTSIYKGSPTTAMIVAATIASRWGEKEAEKYDPRKNCFTFKGWLERGYIVKKGEKAIKSITFIPEDPEDEDSRMYPKTVYLFYKKQVKKLKK